MASLNCPSIDVFPLPLGSGPFMIWHWKIAFILSSSIKANFSQWIQMQCHYYFSWQLFCTAIRNFETENGGKIPLWSIKVNISTRKAILTNIFQFTNILRAAKICGYKFENDLESNYFRQLFCLFRRTLHINAKSFILQNCRIFGVIQITEDDAGCLREFRNCVEFGQNWESIWNCDVCGWSGAWIKLILIQP